MSLHPVGNYIVYSSRDRSVRKEINMNSISRAYQLRHGDVD